MMAAAGHAAAFVPVPPAPASAAALMTAQNWLWAESQLLALAIPAFILFTGLGAGIRTLCARWTGGRRYWTLVLFLILYLIINAAIVAPFDYYSDYIAIGSQTDQTVNQWALNEGVQLLVKIVIASLFVWIPYALIARSPRRWWLYAAVALVPVAFLVLVVLPVWVAPLTTAYRPLQDKSLQAEIETLAARCGVQDIPVFIGGNDDTVVGLGPTKQIILDQDIFKNEAPAQVRFTVGHELKHYVEGDNYKALAIVALLLLAGFWLTNRLGTAAIARFHRRFGFSELSDPALLPLIVLILTAFWLCVLPEFNSVRPTHRARGRSFRTGADPRECGSGPKRSRLHHTRSRFAGLGHVLSDFSRNAPIRRGAHKLRQQLPAVGGRQATRLWRYLPPGDVSLELLPLSANASLATRCRPANGSKSSDRNRMIARFDFSEFAFSRSQAANVASSMSRIFAARFTESPSCRRLDLSLSETVVGSGNGS